LSFIALPYLPVILLLTVGILLYFRLADTYNIIDKPNQRSSHNYTTIRGGGIVFWLAALLYFVMNGWENVYFFIGLTLICGVSFWDDVSSLSNRVRIVVHFLSISLVFYGLGLFSALPVWLILVAYIFFVGVLNAYNFMDGINGMTGLYSLVVLAELQYVNCQLIAFTRPDFINYAILACLVFLFFNCRQRARCFAGDIGSFGISFWIVTLLIQLILTTHSISWILFLAVYGVDTIYTIIHRILLKQNIFKAHRLHFYQIMTNEWGISHLNVSVLYAFVQLVICFLITYFRQWNWWMGINIILILSLIYLLKFKKRTIYKE
jgi:UDP-N-acetylmuramyl pentapeptide phosphotransferase/UDP-N-acetylglucosamine-1-phosphate transferase